MQNGAVTGRKGGGGSLPSNVKLSEGMYWSSPWCFSRFIGSCVCACVYVRVRVRVRVRAENRSIVIPPGPRLGRSVLSVKGLRKSYGDRTLFRDVSFDVEPGAIIGVVRKVETMAWSYSDNHVRCHVFFCVWSY